MSLQLPTVAGLWRDGDDVGWGRSAETNLGEGKEKESRDGWGGPASDGDGVIAGSVRMWMMWRQLALAEGSGDEKWRVGGEKLTEEREVRQDLEREERTGRQAHERRKRQRRGQGQPGVEETDVRRSKLEMRKNSGPIDLVLSIQSKSNGRDFL
jgi:hypothetical protein